MTDMLHVSWLDADNQPHGNHLFALGERVRAVGYAAHMQAAVSASQAPDCRGVRYVVWRAERDAPYSVHRVVDIA